MPVTFPVKAIVPCQDAPAKHAPLTRSRVFLQEMAETRDYYLCLVEPSNKRVCDDYKRIDRTLVGQMKLLPGRELRRVVGIIDRIKVGNSPKIRWCSSFFSISAVVSAGLTGAWGEAAEVLLAGAACAGAASLCWATGASGSTGSVKEACAWAHRTADASGPLPALPSATPATPRRNVPLVRHLASTTAQTLDPCFPHTAISQRNFAEPMPARHGKEESCPPHVLTAMEGV